MACTQRWKVHSLDDLDPWSTCLRLFYSELLVPRPIKDLPVMK